MRWLLFPCAIIALASGCCASYIARSGLNPAQPTTREEVHELFGTPVASGKKEKDGGSYEEFSYHGKVAENSRAVWLWLAGFYTLGTADLFYVPEELTRAWWESSVRGYDLRFQYDRDGNVTKCLVDGQPAIRWPLADSR